ncbi:MAG TPA: hypothetical protein VHE35_25000 [Kofleriaceae bacterium]|nr:hypothetical protein [Kofleriaceae bacterium]
MRWTRAAALAAGLLAVMVGARPGLGDPAVKLTAASEGTIRIPIAADADQLRRTFRLVPDGVDQVEVTAVRALDCTDDHSQSCTVTVVPGGCAAGCTLSATQAGEVTIVAATPAPGTYTASIEIVYAQPGAGAAGAGSAARVEAVAPTTLVVTRPAPTVTTLDLVVAGGTATEISKGFGGATATFDLRLLDDSLAVPVTRSAAPADGGAVPAAPKPGSYDVVVMAAPLVRKNGNDSLASPATVSVNGHADQSTVTIDGRGGTLRLRFAGIDHPGTYQSTVRVVAPGHTAQEITCTITVGDAWWIAGLLIALGALASYGVQWWVGTRRKGLVQDRELVRLRDRLRELAARPGLLDRDRRLIAALERELADRREATTDGSLIDADALARFGRRIDLAGELARAGQDVEKLPLAARATPRQTLDADAVKLTDRGADDTKLRAVEEELQGLATDNVRRAALIDVLNALDSATAQAELALSPDLQQRIAAEVSPALRAAHAALDADQLDLLDQQIAAGRLALARIEAASLGERVPAARPDYFADPAAYAALRADLLARIAVIDTAPGADDAVREYEAALARLAQARAAAIASWCRSLAAGRPAEERSRLEADAVKLDAARNGAPADALRAGDEVLDDARAVLAGPQPSLTAAHTHGRALAPPPLASIPAAVSSMLPARLSVRELTGQVAFGDAVVLAVVTAVAVVTGLRLLWAGSPTWGSADDLLTAFLWGAGLHAVGNDSFKGLLGLKSTLGTTT